MSPSERPRTRRVLAFTAGGALLFAGSLGYFFYRYAIDFGRPVEGSPDAGNIAWNVGLFTLFAAHHSLFARTPVRGWIARRAEPPVERSIYVWVASALFLGVCVLWRPVAGVAWAVDGWAGVALRIVQVAGVLLTLVSAAALDVRELAGLTLPGRAPDRGSGRSTVFKTSGPYGWVRHPIYAGWFLLILSATPMTMTRLVFAVLSCAYLILAIPLEEATLRSNSPSYATYCQAVRWRLVPGLW